jgi:hypothetical protein
MIYPDVSLQDWLKKYPELDVLERTCPACGTIRKADRPFVRKGYAGVEAGNCICGKDPSTCSSQVTTTAEAHKF